jgi:hypothetical protein
MSLESARYLSDSRKVPLAYNTPVGWREVSRGLLLVWRGYLALAVGGLFAAGLAWLAVGGGQAALQLQISSEDRASLLPLAGSILAVSVLIAYVLVLIGQWQCVRHAPHHKSDKELMFVCFNCTVIGSVLSGVGAVLAWWQASDVLAEGVAGLARLDPLAPGVVLFVAGLVLGLLGCLIFTQFLGNVAACFQDEPRASSAAYNLGFMGVLAGGTAGSLLCAYPLGTGAQVAPWLAAGWLLCFGWHVGLVRGVRRGLLAGLRKYSGLRPAVARASVGTVATNTLSGLRRLARGV